MCDCFGVDLFGARLHLSWMSFADVITNQPDAQLARVSWTRPVMIVFCHQRWRVGALGINFINPNTFNPSACGFYRLTTPALSLACSVYKGIVCPKMKMLCHSKFWFIYILFLQWNKMSKMLFSVQRKHNAISGWSFSDWTKKNYKNHFSIINVLL